MNCSVKFLEAVGVRRLGAVGGVRRDRLGVGGRGGRGGRGGTAAGGGGAAGVVVVVAAAGGQAEGQDEREQGENAASSHASVPPTRGGGRLGELESAGGDGALQRGEEQLRRDRQER